MARSQGFSAKSTNGSAYACGYGYTSLCRLSFHPAFDFAVERPSIARNTIFDADIIFSRSPGTGGSAEVSSEQISEHEALSMKRLEDFFDKQDFKSSSPHTSGLTNISSATKKMQKQLQAFDQAFNANGREGVQARKGDAGYRRK
jgi:hypothetical protein